MKNTRGKIKREESDKVVKLFNKDSILHNENIDEAKKLCIELEQRDKNMGKFYAIPIKKGVKIVTREKYLTYIKTNKQLKSNAI
jgi:hypothetical protein